MAKVYERKLLKELKKQGNNKTITVITGMRQVGKTTLLRNIFNSTKSPNKAFLDLENPVNQEIFREKDYDNIWNNLASLNIKKEAKAYIFLDEIQAMPESVKAVKYLFDHYDTQFYLTGSSSYYLKNLFPESLAGRKTTHTLYPLDFEEFLTFKETKKEFHEDYKEKDMHKNRITYEKTTKLYEEFLEYGGFPRVVLSKTTQEKKAALEDIYKSYFQKDVQYLSDFRDITKLQETIKLLMQRCASKLNISNIASELGTTRETIYNHLSFLQATYFIDLVPPYSTNVGTEVAGAKKAYLCDTGILTHFAKVSSGTILENAVYNTIKKTGETRYYQRRTGREIDFIIKEKNIALEVKETGTDQDKKNLERLAKDLKIKENYLITKKYNDKKGFIPATEI